MAIEHAILIFMGDCESKSLIRDFKNADWQYLLPRRIDCFSSRIESFFFLYEFLRVGLLGKRKVWRLLRNHEGFPN